MIDLHCHILPDIDDGPSDISESIEMARVAAADGIKTIVAAPHIDHPGWPEAVGKADLFEVIDEKVDLLNRCLNKEKIPVDILRGGEVSAFLPPDSCQRFTINHTSYLIVEFLHSHFPVNASEIIFNMTVSGLRPIISHPERNPSVIQNPERLHTLVQSGALVQITAASLTGEFGRDAQACALHLLRQRMVSLWCRTAMEPMAGHRCFLRLLKLLKSILERKRQPHCSLPTRRQC
ncbi:MAG TPA: tyrosine protein phosphatase [Desulfobacterales bacterium]|nr:tyrosine protein phosphatase [Desulfobacterales bacterium]